jgi:ABC-type polysaccharide/polyol phosphate export permease
MSWAVVRGMTPQYDVAVTDFVQGVSAWDMWGRLGWQEIKRRYRRTAIGPFWTTLSLGIFISVLGVVWARLWGQDPKVYLPFLTAGMLVWNLVQTIVNEGCTVFIGGESFIKQMPFPYSMLAWSVVWRNLIVFFHNLIIFVVVAFYGSIAPSPIMLLALPGLAFIAINGVWVATLLGLVCARFRDVQQLVASLLQISMFVTPIFFTPDQLGPRGARFVDLNLLYHFVDIVRAPLLGRAPARWSWVVVSLATVVGWGATLWLYSRFRRRVPYWL